MTDFVIRLDAGCHIGSGHLMRCLAYSRAAEQLGADVEMVVSDKESARYAREQFDRVSIHDADKMSLTARDGFELAAYASSLGAKAVIVDTYAVCTRFFAALREGFPGAIAYVDDMFTYEKGIADSPLPWEVSHVINYSFSASAGDYEEVYGALSGVDFPNCSAEREGFASAHTACTDVPAVSACLMIGPLFAPVRREFTEQRSEARADVRRILVTSGATNPHSLLERMAMCCAQCVPDAEVDVVVGGMAEFDSDTAGLRCVTVHRGVEDLSLLMREADVAVSAAGSTLYELSCMGVPTVAVPMVDNQRANAEGFSRSGAGVSLEGVDDLESELSVVLRDLVSSRQVRESYAQRAHSLVDGMGASRVAERLLRR